MEFLSTPSARRATFFGILPRSLHRHFYPRPLRGGRQAGGDPIGAHQCISIHALREEGDRKNLALRLRRRVFLSTPSARRATVVVIIQWKNARNFYPRPPRGGRHRKAPPPHDSKGFLSTPSARRATIGRSRCRIIAHISIHALREEGDTRAAATDSTEPDFYPRPPRGGRRFCKAALARSKNFYPRPPRGGRPGDGPHPCRSCAISIHALREEGDEKIPNCQKCETEFLSTPSARRATPLAHRAQAYPAFLSTPSARRATPLPTGQGVYC